MRAEPVAVDEKPHALLVRIGGLALVSALSIHILVNFFLKEFPPENPTLSELQAYLSGQESTWALVHGLRYFAFPCIILFAAGLFLRTCYLRAASSLGWGVVGLLGSTILVTNGMMTNGIETLAFLDFERLFRSPETFWLLFHITRVLFTAEIVAWALVIFGFSIAGWHSVTMPRWLVALGLLSSVAGLFSGIFIVSVLTDGWASILLAIAAFSGLAWFACVGFHMLIRGAA